MSLQNAGAINQAATALSQLWTNWLHPPGAVAYPAGIGANRAAARQALVTAAINQFGAFLPALTITYPNMGPGVLGGLNWKPWLLEINSLWFAQDAIAYDDFIELCATAYHETRHGEQVYRSAQGLALGPPNGFAPPDTSPQTIIQMGASGGGGVAARIAAFSGNATANPITRQNIVASLLSVPQAVALHADANRAGFGAFVALAKPAWFKRSTMKLEVEEWMRSIAKNTLNGMTMWVEGHGQQVMSMYMDLPVEVDAYGIEANFVSALEAQVGHTRAAQGAQLRTNVGLFGP